MNENNKLSPISRFRRLFIKDKREVTHVYIYAILNGIVNLSLPLGIQAIINLIQGGEVSTSWVVLVVFVLLGYGLTGFFQYMQLRIVENISQRLFSRASFEFSYRFPNIENKALSNYYAPELANRFFDILTVQKGLPKLLIDFSLAVFQILFGLVVLGLYHPFFIIFGILLVVLIFATLAYNGPRGLKTSLNESKYKYSMVHWLEEVARTKVSFKLTPDNTLNLNNTDDRVTGYLKNREAHFGILVTQFSWLIFFKLAIAAGLLIIGGILVFNQEMNIGQFVASEIIIILIIASVEKLIVSLESVYDVLTALEKIGNVTDMPLDKDTGHCNIINKEQGVTIELSNLDYQYSDGERKVLKNIDLKIDKNTKVAIFGGNGSGKTTLLNVISGLFQASSGSVMINGVPINAIDLKELRTHTGYSLGSNEIFAGSIIENVSLGRPNITAKDVIWALKMADLEDYLQTLPDGFNTHLNPEGSRMADSISAKLILARAIVNRPCLLLLEDPLDHINQQDKLQIIQNITNPIYTWTLIVSTVDPAWSEYVDESIVLEEGKIVSRSSKKP